NDPPCLVGEPPLDLVDPLGVGVEEPPAPATSFSGVDSSHKRYAPGVFKRCSGASSQPVVGMNNIEAADLLVEHMGGLLHLAVGLHHKGDKLVVLHGRHRDAYNMASARQGLSMGPAAQQRCDHIDLDPFGNQRRCQVGDMFTKAADHVWWIF